VVSGRPKLQKVVSKSDKTIQARSQQSSAWYQAAPISNSVSYRQMEL